MREESLRWGLGMGAISTGIGVLALFFGQVFEPASRYPDATAVAISFFVRGLLVLISIGIAMALAYVGGFRAEQSRSLDVPSAADPTSVHALASARRVEAALAGGITLLSFWLITSLYMFVLLGPNERPSLFVFLESRVLLGALCVVMGAGMGGLGARAAMARRVLRQYTLSAAIPGAIPALATPATDDNTVEAAPLPTGEARPAPAREEGNEI